MHISATPFGNPYARNRSNIAEVSLGRSGLRVLVESRPNATGESLGLEIHFEVARGFRYLDEGDLLAYWQSEAFAQDHCLFEILSGGWLDQELQHAGMLTTTEAVGTFREWFICTSNGCMNVLSADEPLVRIFHDL